jgi:hypothetical protein
VVVGEQDESKGKLCERLLQTGRTIDSSPPELNGGEGREGPEKRCEVFITG